MAKRPHPIILSLIPGLLLLALFSWARATFSWDLLRVPAMYPDFADLRAVTSAATCARADASWSIESPTCDPFQRPYNYPAWWAKAFARLGWTADRTEAIGLVLVLLTAAAVSALTAYALSALPHQRRQRVLFIASLLAISPPVLLLVERGNIDIIAFSTVVLALLVANRRTNVAIGLLSLATLMKLFPVGGLLTVLRARIRTRPKVVAAMAGATAAVLLLAPDLSLIAARTPQDAPASFGAAVVPLAIAIGTHTPLSALHARLLGWALFGMAFVVLGRLTRTDVPRGDIPGADSVLSRLHAALQSTVTQLSADPIAESMFVSAVGLFCCAYLLGTNWDYRLVVLIPVALSLARLPSTSASRLLLGALIGTMFVSYPLGVFAGLVTDLLLLIVAPLLLLMALRLVMTVPAESNATAGDPHAACATESTTAEAPS